MPAAHGYGKTIALEHVIDERKGGRVFSDGHHVLDGHEGKPFSNRHGSGLAEAFAEDTGSAPRAFEVEFLERPGIQAAFRRPA
jgi:hypothetical protein